MIFGILDFETTSNDAQKAYPTEICFLTYNTVTKKILEIYTTYIKPDLKEESLTEEAAEITGINNDLLNSYGINIMPAMLTIYRRFFCNPLKESPSYLIAHNANGFDRIIWNRMVSMVSGNESNSDYDDFLSLKKMPWIDTMIDPPYPDIIKSKSLMNVCAHYRYYIQDAHKAINDCLALTYLVSQFDPEELIINAMADYFNVVAWLEKPWENRELFEDQKRKAMNLGFRWDGESKTWYKLVREFDLSDLIDKINNDFEITKSKIKTENNLLFD